MNVLVIDVGGTNVKIFATGQKEPRRFPSGPTMRPRQMVAGVKKLAADWQYDVVSIGYPGLVRHGRVAAEPYNLAPGWVGFNFAAAFKRPVKIIKDYQGTERVEVSRSHRHYMLHPPLHASLG